MADGVKLSGAFNINFKAWMERMVMEKAGPAFRDYATRVVEDILEERPNETHTIAVDGTLVSGIAGIQNAKKRVVLHFTQAAVQVAVKEFARILREEVGKNNAGRTGLWHGKLDAVPNGIKVFLREREITNLAEVESFQPGDYIMITSSNPWQQYANTTTTDGKLRVHPGSGKNKHGYGGFFGKAAKRIKTKLRAGNTKTKSGSALWVGAVRSRAVLRAIGMPDLHSQAGIENWNRLQYMGAWAIMVKYSNRSIGSVRG